MTTINILTKADNITLEALKALLFKIDPTAVFEIYNDQSYLSKQDQEKLKKIIELDKNGEIKYESLDQFDLEMRDYLKSLNA